MGLRFKTAVIVVGDLAASTAFYQGTLGLELLRSSENFALFEHGLELHVGDVLATYAYGAAAPRMRPWGDDNLSVYLETDDVDAEFARLDGHVNLLHALRTEPWGQRMFRFKDPDGHIVEVGQALA